MIFWGEPGATRAREVAQDLIDAPTITLCQQNRPLSCPGRLHPARPITLFYMALGHGLQETWSGPTFTISYTAIIMWDMDVACTEIAHYYPDRVVRSIREASAWQL
jgi:hypothetical protein